MSTKSILSTEKQTGLTWVAAISVAVLLIGLIASPAHAWSNLLVASYFLLTIGLGGGVFVALTYVCGGGWHVAFRRVPEALAMLVPFAGAAIILVLALRMKDYGWHHHGDGDPGTYWFKEFWLSPKFWIARAVGYVAIWSLLGAWLINRSRRQDEGCTQENYAGSVRLSALYLVAYALTFSLASADWMMALEPMWFSTMWGVYNFSGMILAALAVVVVLCVRLSVPGGPLHQVFNTEHLHDLGRLMIGFSCFWMYIWFSQYMLIWYSNIPEETSYFITRVEGAWGPVVIVSILLNWVIPFFLLLPRASKRSTDVMEKIAIVILFGRWVDLVLMVFPSTTEGAPSIGIWDIAALAAATAIGLILLNRAFAAANPVPKSDPYLSESMHYHA